jgi:hypothetical protein
MALNLFGLTVDSVRAHHFPQADAWTATSRPSEATVTETIDEEAALMAGKLALELVNAFAITTDSDAYKLCRKILRMQVAVVVARDMTGADPALATRLETTVTKFYEDLDEGGASFLGSGATASGTSDADGPTSHVSVFNLETLSSDDMSSAAPVLRMDDDQ